MMPEAAISRVLREDISITVRTNIFKVFQVL